jgi:hypothetical protein
VALQGTIDAFPLVDVLQLLSASRKTGRLAIDGDRGHGSVWVADGRLVGGEVAGRTPDQPVQLIFEVLRFNDGSFLFEGGADAPAATFEPQAITELLDGAGALIEEWSTIVEVVPSSAHRVRPVTDLPGDDVTLTSTEWSVVVAAASGTDMGDLAGRLALDEFEAARQVCELVARGLVLVEEPTVDPGPSNELVPFEPSTEVHEDPLLVGGSDGPDGSDGDEEPFPERFPIDDLLGDDEHQDDPWSTADAETRADRFAAAQSFGEEPSANGDDHPAPFTHPAFSDRSFGDEAFFDQEYGDQGPVDPGHADSGSTTPAFGDHPGGTDPAFSDAAFTDAAFTDAAFRDPAAPDPAFSGPAFSDPAFSDPAFSDPAFSDPGPRSAPDPAFTDPAFTDPAFTAPAASSAPDGTDEVLRQMSKLSPKAAEAIAAALGTAAEAEEPPADGGAPFLQSF